MADVPSLVVAFAWASWDLGPSASSRWPIRPRPPLISLDGVIVPQPAIKQTETLNPLVGREKGNWRWRLEA